MSSPRLDIISIGTLSRNRIWGESGPVRTAHATTTLIRAGDQHILVDPGLPGPILAARLQERTGLKPEQITTIFLSNFRPSHRAGLALFPQAKRLMHEVEHQAMHQHLSRLIEQAPTEDIDRRLLQDELDLLETFAFAEDTLVRGVDLFPLPGFTPGTCGLLLSLPSLTILLAGDAVPTQDHYLNGQVLPESYDVARAQESLREVYEIADLIVPGHDNIFLNPRAHGF